jgi:riboflavin kinase, archaea type
VSASPGPPKLKSEEVRLLEILATERADNAPAVFTSGELGTQLGVSQQAADRYLVRLARLGLVGRTLSQRRQRLTLTPAAVEILRRRYHVYRRIFEGPARVRFVGTVTSGLGEGRYYLSQPGYVLQFSERLGYAPYPGTLNIRVPPAEMVRVGAVKEWNGIRIDGFQASGRTFGGATCYVGRLSGRSAHLIVPDRTSHKDVVEFVAPEFLREALTLKDGDSIDVEIEES